jgi:transposase-like protein
MKYVTFKNTDKNTADIVVLIPSDLPPAKIGRWFPRRKAQVVAAVHAGALSVVEACRRYGLSPEEFQEWERHYQAGDLEKPRTLSAKPHERSLH